MIALAAITARLRGAWLVVAALLCFGLLLAGGARADAPPRVTVRASSEVVEVGEPFSLEIRAAYDQGTPSPSNPVLRSVSGFDIRGPSESRGTNINSFNGRMQVSMTFGATWTLAGQKPGKYTIPSPTLVWNGQQLSGAPVKIEVVPATGRRRQQPNNPFLLPGFPGGGWPFQNDPLDNDDDEPPPRGTPDLNLPTAPDPLVFVHAIADKKTAVVGEQVTVSFYIYHSRDLHLTGRREAAMQDFLRVPLLKDPRMGNGKSANAGGRGYRAELLDRVALFPLHTGELRTGQMRLSFSTMDFRPVGDRDSEDLVIHVVEPPRAGRPPGYTLGDVGKFELEATVQPRRLEQGGSIAVTLKVKGNGNLPQTLRVPERTGVEWLDPEKKDSIEPQNNVVGGWRTFGYVVRVAESGTVDLGEVTLPFWDPAAKAYSVARAALGTVEVTPTSAPLGPTPDGGAPAAAPEAKVDPFIGLPGARAALGAYTPARTTAVGGNLLWLLIAAPPLLVGVFSAGSSAARRARTRRAQNADSPSALARKALRDAADAEARGDAKGLAAGLDRAVHLAIEAASGLKSRGVLLADLPEELSRRGLPRALGEAAGAVLADCEAIRFEPSPDAARTRDLAARTKKLVAELGRHEAP